MLIRKDFYVPLYNEDNKDEENGGVKDSIWEDTLKAIKGKKSEDDL